MEIALTTADLRDEAIDAARDIDDDRHRANTLTLIASKVGGDRRDELVAEVAGIARELTDPKERAEVLTFASIASQPPSLLNRM